MKTLGIANLLLLLSACNQPAPAISTPPAECVRTVPEPAVPATATDESVAGYIVALVDALRTGNNRLRCVADWRDGVNPASP